MSAVYCGSKRSYFEDIPSPPSTKRMRCCSPSNLPSLSSSVDHLSGAFPYIELPVIVRAVEEYGSDLDAAKRTLCSLTSMEALEKMLNAHAHEEAMKKLQEENVALQQQNVALQQQDVASQQQIVALQQQIVALFKETTVLKRGVAIQHERQNDANQQLEFCKQVIPQYQEKVRSLEVQNYALNMRMQQAEHGSSMPGRFNPDVF